MRAPAIEIWSGPVPPGAIPVATDTTDAPVVEPETVAAVAVDDATARLVVSAVDAVVAAVRGLWP